MMKMLSHLQLSCPASFRKAQPAVCSAAAEQHRPKRVQYRRKLLLKRALSGSSEQSPDHDSRAVPHAEDWDKCWPEPVSNEEALQRTGSGNGTSVSLQCSQATGSSQPAPAPHPDAASSSSSSTDNGTPSGSQTSSSSSEASSSSLDPKPLHPWPPDVPWGLGKVVQVMGLWLLAYIAMGQLLVPALLALLDIDQARLSARGAALLNLCLDVAQVVVTLAILAGCLGRYRPGQRGLFPVAWQGGSWIRPVAAGALSFPIVDWLAHHSVALLSGVDELGGADVWTAQIESGLTERDWLTCSAYVVVVSLCAPLWEEAIFRGFLLPSLAKHLAPPAAALGSALIFAMCHFRAETFAPLLLLGLVFGGLYVRCNNLLPPMVLHSLWNMYVLGTLVLRMRTGCDAVTAALVLAVSTQVLLLLLAAVLQWRPWQRQQQQQQIVPAAAEGSAG